MTFGTRVLLALALLAALWPVAQPAPAYAKDQQIGYLWSIDWDFEQTLNGVMTIEVGPWENGNLVEVHDTSKTTVHCTRVGPVQLDKGDAVFDGASYLRCSMNLAETVFNNHGLVIDGVDDYGSIVLRTRVISAVTADSPIFTHPDAAYSLDFSQTFGVTMRQKLWNGVGPLEASFYGVSYNTWQTYTYLYSCISHGGPCDATYYAGPQIQTLPTAGSRVQFSTGLTVFEIGHNSDQFFNGRMAGLRIDPGNSAH